jgi:hypothetical protein
MDGRDMTKMIPAKSNQNLQIFGEFEDQMEIQLHEPGSIKN